MAKAVQSAGGQLNRPIKEEWLGGALKILHKERKNPTENGS
jgi:hypothetical protein